MILEFIGTIEGLVTLAGFLRLRCYSETSGLLDDEQNGFWKKRACVAQTHSLSTTVCAAYCCFVDFQKAADCINPDFLSFSLLQYGNNDKLFNAVKCLYETPVEWMFATYINDPIIKNKASIFGVGLGGFRADILVYTAGIVLLADTERIIKICCMLLLNIVCCWCNKWRWS